jgi:hypothetical protein
MGHARKSIIVAMAAQTAFNNSRGNSHWGGRLRPLSQSLGKLLAPALRRRGFAVAEVLLRWPAIVGERLAAFTCPEQVSFAPRHGRVGGSAGSPASDTGATLRLRVAPGMAPEIQHLEPLILERINGYYGYRAIARLRLVQRPIALRAKPPAPVQRPLTPDEEARLAAWIDSIADPKLKTALNRLGRDLLAAG